MQGAFLHFTKRDAAARCFTMPALPADHEKRTRAEMAERQAREHWQASAQATGAAREAAQRQAQARQGSRSGPPPAPKCGTGG